MVLYHVFLFESNLFFWVFLVRINYLSLILELFIFINIFLRIFFLLLTRFKFFKLTNLFKSFLIFMF